MKKLFFLILFSFIFAEFTSAQYIYFNKRIDINGYDEMCRSLVSYDSVYYVVGSGGQGLYLSKVDRVGFKVWHYFYSVGSYTYGAGGPGSLFKTRDNNFAIVGQRIPIPATRSYGIFLKVDSSGNKILDKSYDILDNNSFKSGNITKDKGYIFTGDGLIKGSKFRYLLLKADSLGNLQWYQTYTDNHPNRSYFGTSVIQTPDNGYCLGGYGGYYSSPGSYFIAEIIKTDSLGNQQWKKTYGNPFCCNYGTMLCLSLDSCIMATYSLAQTSSSETARQVYLTKIRLNGAVKWNKAIGNLAIYKYSSYIHPLADGSVVISGSSYGGSTLMCGWLTKVNKDGDILWYREYTVINYERDINTLMQVTSTPDGGLAAAGSLDPMYDDDDIWLLKTDSMGCLVPNCYVGIPDFNPTCGAQMLVYPNPFNEAFIINYYIPPESKSVIFKLYDIYGRLIYQTELNKEVKQLQVVASALEAGIYVGNLIVEGKIVSYEKIIKK